MVNNQDFKRIKNNEVKRSGLLCVDCGRPIHLEIEVAIRKNRREIDSSILCSRCHENTKNLSEVELNRRKQKKQEELDRRTASFKNPDFLRQLCQTEDYMAENITYFDPDDLRVRITDWKFSFIEDWWKGHIMLFDKRFEKNSFGAERWNIRVDLPNNFLAILINEKEAEVAANLTNKEELWTKINRYTIYACLLR